MSFRAILLASLFLILSACSSVQTAVYGARVKDIDMPLQTVQHTVASILPVGTRTVSPNAREFFSKYFILDRGQYKAASDALDRYWAQITVLGDSRPYNVEIIVTREQRVLSGETFSYVTVGHDSRLAKQLESRLREALTKRREDRNIIDDFRVF